eukprot:1182754-Prorocentrum_minimum.AAC.1
MALAYASNLRTTVCATCAAKACHSVFPNVKKSVQVTNVRQNTRISTYKSQYAVASFLRISQYDVQFGAKVPLQGYTSLYLGCTFPPINVINFGHIQVPAREGAREGARADETILSRFIEVPTR